VEVVREAPTAQEPVLQAVEAVVAVQASTVVRQVLTEQMNSAPGAAVAARAQWAAMVATEL